MEKKGLIKVTDDLILKDFNWDIVGCRYDWINHNLIIEVKMWEKHQKHSREFEFKLDKNKSNITADNCMKYILSLDQFKGSIL